jgi:ATP-dependent Lon protease
LPGLTERDPFRVYGVNVILAHGDEDTSPVIFETTPTYANLFGTIQRAYDARGGWTSDFMDLRGGSLLRADGGFLIMYSLEALSETGVWRALKRTLNHSRLEIQPLEMFYPFGGSALKPEAVQLDVKVILIGDRELYEVLYQYEEDFRKIFKVRVEFDEEMHMSDGVNMRAACARCAKKKIYFRLIAEPSRPCWNTGYARPGGAIKLRRDLWTWPIWHARRTTRQWPREKR